MKTESQRRAELQGLGTGHYAPRMIVERNSLTGDYMCWIPEVAGQAYFVKGAGKAQKFAALVNADLVNGVFIVRDGKLIRACGF